jgi:hypothetical protein
MSDVPVADDEIILRHIPGGTTFQASGPRLTSINFQVRTATGETGVSVTREAMMTPDAFLVSVGADIANGSRIATATVGEIRALGLQVVPDPLPDNPGHAEIRSGSASLSDRDTRRRLANLFQFT